MNNRIAAAASAAVLALATPVILHYEGTRLAAYRDPIGIITVCTGHTGYDVQENRTYSYDECANILARDIAEHNAGVIGCVKLPMPDNVHAAMLSFAFNVGVPKFCSSTLAKKLNSGDFVGACAELSRWTLAGGRKLPGLERRRAAERALCEGKPA